MKKVILFMLVAVLGLTTANAQDKFKAGGKTLSGQLTGFDFSYATGENDYKDLNVVLSVAGSYFVADNIAVGLQLGVASNKFGDNDATTAFAFGVNARYYVWDGLYAQLGYLGQKQQDVDLLSYVGVEVGYDYYITENVFFEPAIYFQKGLSKGDKTSTFGLAIGIGVNF